MVFQGQAGVCLLGCFSGMVIVQLDDIRHGVHIAETVGQVYFVAGLTGAAAVGSGGGPAESVVVFPAEALLVCPVIGLGQLLRSRRLVFAEEHRIADDIVETFKLRRPEQESRRACQLNFCRPVGEDSQR